MLWRLRNCDTPPQIAPVAIEGDIPLARRTKPSSRPAAGASQRQLRVGELIRHALSELLSRGDIHDDVLATHTVTVPEVRCSPDLRHATVYVMPLGGRDTDDVIAALEHNAKFIRGVVARAVNLKYAPDLIFKADPSFDEAQHIDRLLNSPDVRRDVERSADEE